METKEFYVVYLDEDNILCHLYISAHTAREALANFWSRETHKYFDVVKVIEWISNSSQVTHLVKDNKIITT